MHDSTHPRLSLLVIAFCLGSQPVEAADFTVGPNAATCDFTNLQVALATAQDGDRLFISGGTYFGGSGINFNMFGKAISLYGGHDSNCNGVFVGAPTILQGGGADTVLEIDHSTVAPMRIQDLAITGGEADADDGGGIQITGDIWVTLDNVSVVSNASDVGAGILIEEDARLDLVHGTVISFNEAETSGGGIACFDSDLVSFGSVLIANNDASFFGGGISATGCDIAVFESQDGLSVVSNTATIEGGGIHLALSNLNVVGGDSGHLTVELNTAELGDGGGFALVQSSSASLRGSSVSANEAPSGSGGGFSLDNSTLEIVPDPSNCSGGSCNQINANKAESSAALFLRSFSSATLEGVDIRSNLVTGSGSIGSVDSDSTLVLSSVTAFDNSADDLASFETGAIDIFGFGSVVATSSTFVGQRNLHFLVSTPFSNGFFDGDQLIVWDNDGQIFNDFSTAPTLDCSIVQETTSIPAGHTGNLVADPLFVNSADGDFHIFSDSPAVDHCSDPATAHVVDFEQEARPYGSGYDAGADEESGADIFRDGFESGNTNAWTATAP